jgi:hypothetical protein
MATNFPDTSINNPNTGVGWANGDAFDDTAESGLIYYWYDPVWKTNISAADADDKYVEVDGDTMTGDLTVPSLNGGQLAGFRNQIINGDFRVWQRGTSFTTPAPATYTADRVSCSNNGGGNWTQTEAVPPGFTYGMSLPAGSIPVFGVELFEAGNAGVFAQNTTWTFSFYSSTNDWRSDGGSFEIAFSNGQATGSDTVTVVSAPVTWNIETVGSFYRYTLTFTIGVSPNSNSNCLRIYIRSASASIITGVQLEPGPVATPFEHRPIAAELALCQRYYQTSRLVWQNYASSTGGTTHTSNLPVTMRTVSATVTTSSSSGGTIGTARLQQGYGKNPCSIQLSTSDTGAGNQVATDYAVDAEL